MERFGRWTRLLAAAPAAPEQLQDRQKQVQQVEINPDRRQHVVIGAVHVPDAPRVVHEQAGENQDGCSGEPELNPSAVQEQIEQRRADQHDQANEEERAPRAEVAAADEGVQRQRAERRGREQAGLAEYARLYLGVVQQDRGEEDAFHEREQEREANVRRKAPVGRLRGHERCEHEERRDPRVRDYGLQDLRLRRRERGARDREQHAGEDQCIRAANESRSLGAAPDDLGRNGVGHTHGGSSENGYLKYNRATAWARLQFEYSSAPSARL